MISDGWSQELACCGPICILFCWEDEMLIEKWCSTLQRWNLFCFCKSYWGLHKVLAGSTHRMSAGWSMFSQIWRSASKTLRYCNLRWIYLINQCTNTVVSTHSNDLHHKSEKKHIQTQTINWSRSMICWSSRCYHQSVRRGVENSGQLQRWLAGSCCNCWGRPVGWCSCEKRWVHGFEWWF